MIDVEEFVDSLLPNGWSDEDNRDAVCTEVDALLSDGADELVVCASIRNMFEAVQLEYE